MAVRFIGGRNWNTLRKPPTCRTVFMINKKNQQTPSSSRSLVNKPSVMYSIGNKMVLGQDNGSKYRKKNIMDRV
jgi:hypothetical protein